MSLPVDVSSIEVLETLREGLIFFGDDAKNALGQMEMEIRRCIDWLTNEQRIHWQGEIKKRKEKLSEAKAELHRKQLSNMSGGNAKDSEQREQVREAKLALEHAENQLERVRRWIPELERAVMEYDGIARSFDDMLEHDLRRNIDMVERMIVALEEYTRLAPPETTPKSPPPAPGGSGPGPAPAPASKPVAESAPAVAKPPPPAEPTVPVPTPASEEVIAAEAP